MFQVNDVVVYGNHGVCKIMDVGPLSMSLADKDTIYYTLCPVYQRETLFYAPVDNQKVLIRPLITKEEAEKLIFSSLFSIPGIAQRQKSGFVSLLRFQKFPLRIFRW